ncbi:hypothetical protein TNCV_3712761 [Trichonephila clavipes]|nr:hypothetical protein TNCV_3712761 [Trichonephila clavipes]
MVNVAWKFLSLRAITTASKYVPQELTIIVATLNLPGYSKDLYSHEEHFLCIFSRKCWAKQNIAVKTSRVTGMPTLLHRYQQLAKKEARMCSTDSSPIPEVSFCSVQTTSGKKHFFFRKSSITTLLSLNYL